MSAKWRWKERAAAWERHLTEQAAAARAEGANRVVHIAAAHASIHLTDVQDGARPSQLAPLHHLHAILGPPPVEQSGAASAISGLSSLPIVEHCRALRAMGLHASALDHLAGRQISIEAMMELLGLGAPTWAAWRAVARLLDGTHTLADAPVLAPLLGAEPPQGRVQHAWLACGRRAGKSQFLGVAGAVAALRAHDAVETPVVGIVARTQLQAREAYNYVKWALSQVGGIEGEPNVTNLRARGGTEVRISPCSQSVRGPTYVALLVDEIAFLPTGGESAYSDSDLITALTPGLATVPDSLLLCASSPWRMTGELWRARERLHGNPHDGAVYVQAATRTLNPSLDEERMAAEIARNPALAAEFEGEFTADGGALLPSHVLAADVVDRWPDARPPSDLIDYVAFADVAAGGEDSAALAIGHRDGDRLVLDALEVVDAPVIPKAAATRFSALMRRYRCESVTCDNFAAQFQRDWWHSQGITPVRASQPKRRIYAACVTLLLDERCDLLRHDRLITELRELRATRGQGGELYVDAPVGRHDDTANAVCGLLHSMATTGEFFAGTGG